MKLLTLKITVLIVCFAGAAYARDMSGTWQGTIQGRAGSREIVRIKKARDGAWEADKSSIDEGRGGGPIHTSLVTVNGKSIKIAFSEIGITYEGTVNEDGTKVSGIWKQGNESNVFDLRKVTPATEWKDTSPHKVRFVAVEKNVELEVLDWGGTGRPLVLLAGLGNTAHVFDKFAPKLTVNYHVYGITRRGFGASSKPPPAEDNYNADRLGEDVFAGLAALKLDGPVLAGHSIAGEELSSIGTCHPESVSGLVYLDAAYPYAFLKAKPTGTSRMIAKPAVCPVPPPAPVSMTVDGVGKSKLPAPTTARDAIARGRRAYTSVKPPFLALIPVPHQCQPDCDAEFMKLDAAEMTAQADTLQAAYPNARIVRLHHANHYVFLSDEADVLREMNTFMKGLPKSR